MTPRRPAARRIVIAGSGVAALEAMLAVRHLAPEQVETVLVTPGRELVHRPLVVAEPSGLAQVHRFDLATIAESAGAQLRFAKVVAVDPGGHRALTDDGGELDYDILVVASGARPRPALAGAITHWGLAGTSEIAELIADLGSGVVERVAFAAHAHSGWQLGLYELALLTDSRLRRAGAGGYGLVLVTPEDEPLEMLGADVSSGVRGLLEARGIDLVTGRHPATVRAGALDTDPDGSIEVDRVVTLPRLEGPRLAGLPCDGRGFIPVDALGRVRGTRDVYAAGDATSFAVKQGEMAAQQAYAVATAVAAAAGAAVEPEPFRPVLRGILTTGFEPRLVRTVSNGGGGDGTGAETLWWPPDGIAGRYLAPYLAAIAGGSLEPAAPSEPAGMAVEVELSAEAAPA